MGTEILKSFGALQSELDQARTSLKGVDESIKRLIGRDPSDVPPRSVLVKRSAPVEENRRRLKDSNVRNRNFGNDNDTPSKTRRLGSSVFNRLSERIERPGYNEDNSSKQMISKVIVTPKEVPSRQEALDAQNKDEKFKARNRRMFGALLGTLQKFQQEETKLKPREEKRAQLEKKIEEHEIKEKEEIKKERQELFLSRKKKQAEIKVIELKMLRMKEFAVWEERQKPRMNFIKTKSKPHILYLPRKLNDTNRTALDESKTEVQRMLDKKRQDIQDELLHIEERMRRNFESKSKDEKQTEDELEQHDNVEHEFTENLDEPIKVEVKQEEETIETSENVVVETPNTLSIENNNENCSADYVANQDDCAPINNNNEVVQSNSLNFVNDNANDLQAEQLSSTNNNGVENNITED